MKTSALWVCLLAAQVSCSSGAPQSAEAADVQPEIGAIRKALSKRIEDGTIKGHQYMARVPVNPIVAPALAKALPHLRFFTTTLGTPHLEYLDVELALSISRNGKPLIRATCFSPSIGFYRAVDADFLKEFIGATADSEAEQLALGNDIARLFASIIHEGSVRSARIENNRFRCEILWNGTRWDELRVEFVAGRVVSVTF
jgi:hypothetical protein